MTTNNLYRRVAPVILFVLALFLLFKLIQPVITILISSILLAYISFPIFRRIRKRVPNESFSIILSLLVVVIIILIPFSILAFEVTHQGYVFYRSLSTSVEKGALFGFSCNSAESTVCLLVNQAESFSVDQLSKYGLDTQLQNYLPVVQEKVKSALLRIPLIVAQMFLTLFITYFVLKDYKNILRKVSEAIPMRSQTKKQLIKDFGSITYSVIFAQLFVAFVQGIVGIIGFYIFGVPFPILLGILIAFFALMPFIGTSFVWVPASIYLLLSGYFSHDYWVLGKGIGLLLYGVLFISTIDNILLAKIVKARTNVSPIIVILGVIGGISMFGILGIFIGPILLPLLVTYFSTSKEGFAGLE